jgi:predicted PurR-regulated permease PerM
VEPAWSPRARRRTFHIVLGLSALSVVWLMSPFLDVILFAGVVAVVCAPLHRGLTLRMRGRRHAAAVIVTFCLGIAVFVPFTLLGLWALAEGYETGRDIVERLGRPETRNWILATRDAYLGPLTEALEPVLPEDVDLVGTAVARAEALGSTLFQGATRSVPALLGGATNLTIDAVLFVFTVMALLADGPRMWNFIERIVPLEEAYQERLLAVFKEFANNLVVGGLATAAAMGLVAMVGYLIFGVPRAVFFGGLTAIASFVPAIGTALVAVPLSIWVAMMHGWQWGVGLALWSVVFTGTTDNLLRPLFMRGSSDMHPLLLFFAVFGGMYWLGLTGVLVGPVLVAVFLTLATLHEEAFEQA